MRLIGAPGYGNDPKDPALANIEWLALPTLSFPKIALADKPACLTKRFAHSEKASFS